MPLFFTVLYCFPTAYTVGMWQNECADKKDKDGKTIKGYRPNIDDDLVLVAEPSPKSARFQNGIRVVPSARHSFIIGRIEASISNILAPLMRTRQVITVVHFDFGNFGGKKWWTEIDVYGDAACGDVFEACVSVFIVFFSSLIITDLSRCNCLHRQLGHLHWEDRSSA